MKKIIYSILLCVFIFSCDKDTKTDNLSVSQSFEQNKKTMQVLLDSYANENVDY